MCERELREKYEKESEWSEVKIKDLRGSEQCRENKKWEIRGVAESGWEEKYVKSGE